MKQILLILTIVFISVVALYGQVGIELEFTLLECGTAYEVSGKGIWDYEVFIPETHEGIPVTRIADFGFYYTRMVRTCLPNSIKSIGKYAFGRSFGGFGEAYSLISIPLSVEYIGRSAFEGYQGFVIFVEAESKPTSWHKRWNSNNVPVQWGHDGSFFFFTLIEDGTAYEISKGYTPLSHIVIPSSHLGLPVTKIGDFSTPVWMPGMFRFNLKSIYIPDSVRDIGESAFSRSYMTEINLPKSITFIGDEAFWGSEFLSEIVIPNSVTHIGNNAFRECARLVNVVLPNNLTSLGDGVFMDCSSLVTITIPNSVTSIGNSAFERCTSLVEITLPNNLSSLSDRMFMLCINLAEIVIPNSVTTIGNRVFEGCSSLTRIIIPYGVTSIGNRAFLGCSNLTEIVLSNNLNSIGDSAFLRNSSLTEIHIPISVAFIGASAFRLCDNLTIYAELDSPPTGWHENWNPDNRPVVWGHVSEAETIVTPFSTELLGNYPNPFNPVTSIRYQVSGIGSHIQINIYNVRGQRIRTLVNDYHDPGHHSVVWNGRDDCDNQVGSGVYFYRLSVRDAMNVVYTVDTRKMMLLK